jgi:hypothetical protein
LSLTKSERLFEEFCKQTSIRFERIPECQHRTPDYRINVSGIEAICEVKEIGLSKEEMEAEAASERGEVASFGRTVGSKVRQQIDSGYDQIKQYAKDHCPGILVLWESHWIPRHLEHHQIRAAMYGFDSIVVAVPRVPSTQLKVLDRKSGPKKRVSESQNRSLSAIAAIRKSNDGDVIECRIYHNKFASIPLPPEAFNFDHVWQFKLSEKVPGQFDEWEYVTPPAI